MTGPGAASRETLAAGISALDGIIDRSRRSSSARWPTSCSR